MSDDPRSEHPEQFMTEREVAHMLNCSPKTLRNDRYLGRGLPWVKFGRKVRYSRNDVLARIATLKHSVSNS